MVAVIPRALPLLKGSALRGSAIITRSTYEYVCRKTKALMYASDDAVGKPPTSEVTPKSFYQLATDPLQYTSLSQKICM
jgi:hypothetical protein